MGPERGYWDILTCLVIHTRDNSERRVLTCVPGGFPLLWVNANYTWGISPKSGKSFSRFSPSFGPYDLPVKSVQEQLLKAGY